MWEGGRHEGIPFAVLISPHLVSWRSPRYDYQDDDHRHLSLSSDRMFLIIIIFHILFSLFYLESSFFHALSIVPSPVKCLLALLLIFPHLSPSTFILCGNTSSCSPFFWSSSIPAIHPLLKGRRLGCFTPHFTRLLLSGGSKKRRARMRSEERKEQEGRRG